MVVFRAEVEWGRVIWDRGAFSITPLPCPRTLAMQSPAPDRASIVGSPLRRCLLLLGAAIAIQAPHTAQARDIHVDPAQGSDAADGLSARPEGASGPVKSILRAVKLAGPGDTIHLSKTTYHETFDLTNRHGEPGKPLIIDGHGATLDGARLIDPADWIMVAPGLYRNTTLFAHPLHKLEEWVWRFFVVFDGRVNRMDRCSKGNNVPWKTPADLQPGEWTYQKDDEHAFYVRVDAAKSLAEARISVPWEVNGVSIHGNAHDITVRNLTATRVINDGYNISPSAGRRMEHIVFENIASIECGDDGLSAHDDCHVSIDGFYSTGNATGLCTTGDSVNNRLYLRKNVGFEMYFYESPVRGTVTHTITNSLVECAADNAFLAMGGRDKDDRCVVTFDNVHFTADPAATPRSRTFFVRDRARLEANRVTMNGLLLDIGGLGLSLNESIVAGGAAAEVKVQPGSDWRADRNVYDVARITIGPRTFLAESFEDYRRQTSTDAASRWTKLAADAARFGHPPVMIDDKTVGAALRLVDESIGPLPAAGDSTPLKPR